VGAAHDDNLGAAGKRAVSRGAHAYAALVDAQHLDDHLREASAERSSGSQLAA